MSMVSLEGMNSLMRIALLKPPQLVLTDSRHGPFSHAVGIPVCMNKRQ